ncbi:MAG: hypothetical protein GXP47_02115 [Acidobacteria bacterium]|nr:hypothetical protein [Acidobacteriota bacterium]
MISRTLKTTLALVLSVGLLSAGCKPQAPVTAGTAAAPTHAERQEARLLDPDPREIHFSKLHMLTDGGENAEAYFSFDGKRLIFQSTRPPFHCDQIFSMGIDGSDLKLVSAGKGRTTCAYYYPDGRHVLYSSTHLAGDACPPPPDHSQGYVWALYPSYDIFRADADGKNLVRLTDTPGYDAEATISPRGDRMVFTSMRDGDLDIYTMNLDGTDVRRLTDALGYDGGPFFSPDGSKIVYRAYHPTSKEEIDDYTSLLRRNLIRPTTLEIWVMNADGSDKRQITHLNAASFAPFFHPSGKKIIFSSNHGDPRGREFDLWMVNLDGTGLERITYSKGFDGFPMWAPDGKTFVFCSNRHDSAPHETNVFVTTWKD